MIFPIGHEDSAVRRLPWVTWSIIGLCCLIFLATDTSNIESLPSREDYLADAGDYWREHAYLDALPEVRTEVGYDVTPNQRKQYLEVLADRSADWAPDDPIEWANEQAELDRLTGLALGDQAPGATAALDNPFYRWGLVPASPRAIGWVAHIFMHAGWLHLLGNMLLLFIAGPAIEDRWGRALYGGFFVSAGMFAGLFYSLLARDPSIPMVGASGAIAAVFGAFMVRLWSTQIRFGYLFFLGLRFVRGTFEAPAWLIAPLWFGNELFQAWLWHSMDMSTGVAYWAHVGGFVFGAGAALAIRQSRVEERFIHPSIEARVTVSEGNPRVEAALEAREQGDHERAFAALADEVALHPTDPDAALALWDVAVSLQRPAEAAPALVRIISELAKSDPELATENWLELTNIVPSALAQPAALMRLLPVLREQGQRDRTLLAMRHAVDPQNEGLTPGMALRIFEQTRVDDPPTALRAGRAALEAPDLDERKRERIESRVAELEEKGVTLGATVAECAAEAESQSLPWDRTGAIEIDEDDEFSSDFMANRNATEDEAHLRASYDAGGGLGEDAPGGPGDSSRELALDADGGLVADERDSLAADLADGVDDDLTPPPLPIAMPPPLPEPVDAASTPGPPPVPEIDPISGRRIVGDSGALPPVDAHSAMDPAPVEPVLELGADDEVVQLPAASAALEDDLDALEAAIALPRFAGAKIVDGAPLRLEQDSITVRTSQGRKARIAHEQIEALAVAGVRGLSSRPVLVIDLLLNWSDMTEGTLRSVRLRSDNFDAQRLVGGTDSPTAALRALVSRLLERSEAIPLPDAQAATGQPFRVFDDLSSYEREVLQVDA